VVVVHGGVCGAEVVQAGNNSHRMVRFSLTQKGAEWCRCRQVQVAVQAFSLASPQTLYLHYIMIVFSLPVCYVIRHWFYTWSLLLSFINALHHIVHAGWFTYWSLSVSPGLRLYSSHIKAVFRHIGAIILPFAFWFSLMPSPVFIMLQNRLRSYITESFILVSGFAIITRFFAISLLLYYIVR